MKKKSLTFVIVFLLILAGASEIFAQFKPGTYNGSAYGRKDKKHSGLIEVEVKVSESRIEDIKVKTYEQSVDHKKYGKQVTKAKDKVVSQILANQYIDVDGVAKATMASNAIELAVAKALHKAADLKFMPGTYKGSAYGRKDKKHAGLIEVEVKVSNDKIEDIKILTYDQSVKHKKYGKHVKAAKANIIPQIIEKQSLEVDVVAKATFASNAIDLAVARALAKALVKH